MLILFLVGAMRFAPFVSGVAFPIGLFTSVLAITFSPAQASSASAFVLKSCLPALGITSTFTRG